jgi:hypothetical protein
MSNLPQEPPIVKGGSDHSAPTPQESGPPVRYAIMSMAVNSDRRLTGADKSILNALYFFGRSTKRVWAGRKKIALEAGVNESTVKRRIPKLVELGYISIDPVPPPMNASWRVIRLDWLDEPNQHPQPKAVGAFCPTWSSEQMGHFAPTGGGILPKKSPTRGGILRPYNYKLVEEEKEKKEGRPSLASSTDQLQRANSSLKAEFEIRQAPISAPPLPPGQGKVDVKPVDHYGIGGYRCQRRGSATVHLLTADQFDELKRRCGEHGGTAQMEDHVIDRLLEAIKAESNEHVAERQMTGAELKASLDAIRARDVEISARRRACIEVTPCYGFSTSLSSTPRRIDVDGQELALLDGLRFAELERRAAAAGGIEELSADVLGAMIEETRAWTPEFSRADAQPILCLLDIGEIPQAARTLEVIPGLEDWMVEQGGDLAEVSERIDRWYEERNAPPAEEDDGDESGDEEDDAPVAVPMPYSTPQLDPVVKIVVERVEPGCSTDHVTAGGRALAKALDDDKSLRFFFKILNEVRDGQRPRWHVIEALDEAVASDSPTPGAIFTNRIQALQPLGKGQKHSSRQGTSERWG